ncbi:23S rRNA (uracil(1939)-C(5))-methyltransferase RlmD [Pediococcus siamensis]|uniref:23S rRNA (uracil(1939)-C(5))-methyltransferase RlmD n=1 Tax=Pediococcus siamensis TaxID=381829 RepID=UPI0039A1B429
MKFKAPVTKNETYDVTVMDLTYQGMGVAKIENFPIFIANSLPGEEIVMKVTKVAKTYAFGRVESWKSKSPDRVELKNKQYTQTGIAPLQHLAYPAQLEFKQHQIQELFYKAHLDQIEVSPTIGMEKPYGYRNKAQIPVREVNGQLTTGFYRRNSHDLVPIEDFYIQDPEIDKAIVVIRDILRQFHVEPYNETNHTGVVRTIMVRRGHYSHEMMVVLITRAKKIPMAFEVVEAIRKQLPEVKSIIQNVNAAQTNVLLGKEEKILWGSNVIHDQLLGLTFAISADSFYQVNPEQTNKLYDLAIKKAVLTGKETVIDAYCGIGTISLAMAKHAKKVYGVEIVDKAIQDAKINAQLNKIKNVKFVTGKAEDQMAKWQADGLKPDVIVVDPPRKGLAPEFIAAATEMQPKRVVYVSCNPATLVRDVQTFMAKGYHVSQPIIPLDQFPQTPHVESVTVLEQD